MRKCQNAMISSLIGIHLLFSPLLALGQDKEVKGEITFDDGIQCWSIVDGEGYTEVSNKCIISYDYISDVQDSYELIDASGTYSYHIEDGKTETRDLQYERNGQNVRFYAGFEPSETGRYIFNAQMNLTYRGAEESDIITIPIKGDNVFLTVYATSQVNVVKESSLFCKIGDKLNWDYEVEGGCNWDYELLPQSSNAEVKPNEDAEGKKKYSLIYNSQTEGKEEVNLTFTVKGPDGKIWKDKFKYNYVIDNYQAPSSDLVSNKEMIVLCNKDNPEIRVKKEGGFADGWNFEWKCNNKTLDNTSESYIVQPENTTSDVRTDIYEITTKNYSPDNIEWYSNTYTVTVHIVPAINVTSVQDKYDVKKDDIIRIGVDVTGGNPNGWKYDWISLDKATGVIDVKIENEPEGISTESYKLIVTNSYNSNEIWRNEYTYQVNVYPSPKFNTSEIRDGEAAGENVITTCGGHVVNMSINCSDGFTNGWTYEWYKNDNLINGETSPSYTITVNDESRSRSDTDIYKVVYSNGPNSDGSWFSGSKEFKVTHFGRPDAELLDENKHSAQDLFDYEGESYIFTVDAVGGDPDGWSYVWKKDGKDTGNTSYSYEDSHQLDKDEIEKNSIITVNVLNKHDGYTWYDESFTFNIHTVSHGNVGELHTDSLDIYEGQHVSLEVQAIGGNPEGWSYEWRRGDSKLATTTSPEYDFVMENVDAYDNYNEQVLSVIASNHINNKQGALYTKSTTLKVWPKAEYGINFDGSEMICEGDDITLQVSLAHNGYQGKESGTGWFYDWYQVGVNAPVKSSKDNWMIATSNKILSEDDKMAKQTISYYVIARNVGPSGKVWDSYRYSSKETVVYRRPQTPSNLVRKGDGITCMMIAFSDLNDMRLQNAEYHFVFGYTDASGVMHRLEETSNRYYRFDNSQEYRQHNSYWVYAVWHYTDGAIVSSGLRYLEGEADEAFNASDFSFVTRGVVDDVQSMKEDDIIIEGGRVRGRFTTSLNGIITVYSQAGQAVAQREYQGVKNLSEDIPLQGLSSGFYIVNCQFGNIGVTKKIIVK